MRDMERKVTGVRISEAGLAKIDDVRGDWTRSEFIRHAVVYAIKQGVKGPERQEWST